MPQMLFWLAATVVFLLIEWPTMGLTTIWFAGGSLVAGLLAVFSCPFSIQFAVFLVVSVALLLFTRPLAIKYLNTNRTRTNVDSLIGKEAVITETISGQGYHQYRGTVQQPSASPGLADTKRDPAVADTRKSVEKDAGDPSCIGCRGRAEPVCVPAA